MRTVSSCIEELLPKRPFIEEALNMGILNFSSLASALKDDISNMIGKPVKEGAIIMALRRHQPTKGLGNTMHIKKALTQIGDITVRSGLMDITFNNSKTLINAQVKLLEQIQKDTEIFYAYTRGIYESNLIINKSFQEIVTDCFKGEKQNAYAEDLSSITIKLPEINKKVTGLYYHIFKQIAWEGINLYEVVSTTNEFSIIVEDNVVEKAFSVIKALKK